MSQGYNDPSFEEGFEPAPSHWLKWGKPGNVFKGVLIGKEEKKEGLYGAQVIYELRGIDGFFNPIIDKVVQDEIQNIVKGELYKVGFKKNSLQESQLRHIEYGTQVIFRFIGEVAMEKGMAKNISVLIGPKDPDWESGMTFGESDDSVPFV